MHALASAGRPTAEAAIARPGGDGPSPAFDFVLTPHRALDDAAFLRAAAVLVGVTSAAFLGLLVLGHGLVGLLVYVDGLFLMAAMAAWRRDRSRSEHVRLVDGVLHVERRLGSGESELSQSMPAYGAALRLVLDAGGRATSLRLWHCEIGAALSAGERASFARALHDALAAERLAPRLDLSTQRPAASGTAP